VGLSRNRISEIVGNGNFAKIDTDYENNKSRSTITKIMNNTNLYYPHIKRARVNATGDWGQDRMD